MLSDLIVPQCNVGKDADAYAFVLLKMGFPAENVHFFLCCHQF